MVLFSVSLLPHPGKLFFSGWSSQFGILTRLLKISLFCKLIQKLICSECFVEIQSYSINPLVKILLIPLFLAHIICPAEFLLQLEKSIYKVFCLGHFIWIHRTILILVLFFINDFLCPSLLLFIKCSTCCLPLMMSIVWFGPSALSVLPCLEKEYWGMLGFKD